MLILNRRTGEIMIINDDIVIKVISVIWNQVRMGVEVPADVNVFRGEIHDAVRNANRAAMESVVHWIDKTNQGRQKSRADELITGLKRAD